jgi:hypothetical protein
MSVFTNFKLVGSQRWFSQVNYQKLNYSQQRDLFINYKMTKNAKNNKKTKQQCMKNSNNNIKGLNNNEKEPNNNAKKSQITTQKKHSKPKKNSSYKLIELSSLMHKT